VYRKKVQKASKETWRTFCTSINELPKAARVHRALSKDPKVRLGCLVAPLGKHMQSEGKTLDLLLVQQLWGRRHLVSPVVLHDWTGRW
jgi:hypothetical protein